MSGQRGQVQRARAWTNSARATALVEALGYAFCKSNDRRLPRTADVVSRCNYCHNQSLLDLVANSSGGSLASVPEPASLGLSLMAAAGLLAVIELLPGDINLDGHVNAAEMEI